MCVHFLHDDRRPVLMTLVEHNDKTLPHDYNTLYFTRRRQRAQCSYNMYCCCYYYYFFFFFLTLCCRDDRALRQHNNIITRTITIRQPARPTNMRRVASAQMCVRV